jgi:ABC-type sugar transport system ATPase subunit
MAEVALDRVSKAFGDTVVVDGVTLTASDREFLVLVGPSGCGKSTCLRMIAGLETTTGGDILIGGRRINDVAPKDRDIGMVFQSYALYPHMTVRRNMAFGLELRRASRETIESRVGEAARILGLEKLLDRKPKELSGGQRQRVAIGRAICRQPEVFLFDEPLSNLDAAMRVAMRTELAELHARLDATMIYVTHDQVEAMTLADRIAVLDGGVLQQVGTPLELFETPANRFVAGFIGSPAMSFFSAARRGDGLEILGVTIPAEGLPDAPEMIAGARPQDLALADGPIRGQVSLVELLGWEAYVHVDTGEQTVIVRADGRRAGELAIGDAVGFSVDPGRLHFFDAVGARLASPS